jgi:RepB plasmid partitioning protein/ParB-like nuclease domain
MTQKLRSAFQESMFTLPVASIIPRRATQTRTYKSVIFKQIHSSIKEIGLIEPLVVFAQEGRGFLLLDGHLRLEVLKELGIGEVKCLLATEQEGYKTRMLDGICPEVVELLRNRNLSAVLFPILRRMKPIIQIATAELMVLRNDFTVSFAKTRLALTPTDLLIPSLTARQLRADSEAAQAILQEDTQTLVRNLKAVEESYGTDILALTVACAYIERLLSHVKIVRYMDRHHAGVLETVQSLLSEVRPPKIQQAHA